MNQEYCDRQPDFCGIVWLPGYAFGKDGTIWTRWKMRGGAGNRRTELEGVWRKRTYNQHGKYVLATLFHLDGSVSQVRLHTLILTAFVGPAALGQEARHWPDPDTKNNALSNLEWGSRSDNRRDQLPQGVHNIGENNGLALLSNNEVRRIRERLALGESERSIADDLCVSWRVIRRVALRETYVNI